MSQSFETFAWSCTMRLVVADDTALAPAARDFVYLLDRVDRAASRFRADSALSIANARAGKPCAIPRLLVDLVAAALDAAATTGGAVDPTLGLAMQRIGYDRDIAAVRAGDVAPAAVAPPPSLPGGWRNVRLHRETGLLTVPVGTALDLGATAKAWTADHAARTLAARYGTAVLVELGGDVAVAGARPNGWTIDVAEHAGGPGEKLTLRHGGLTTSTTTVRTWGAGRHHIVDPATGRPADGPWRTATVAARSALVANTASTAAIVLGDAAPARLAQQGHAARLVDRAGRVYLVGAWPSEAVAA